MDCPFGRRCRRASNTRLTLILGACLRTGGSLAAAVAVAVAAAVAAAADEMSIYPSNCSYPCFGCQNDDA